MNHGIKRPLLGAHMSIAGGVHQAILLGQTIGCEAIQIFTKPSRQWIAKPYNDDDVRNFKNLKKEHNMFIMAHDSYLLNIGSPQSILRKKSVDGMIDELNRCEQLEIPYLIVHPGSHTGSGEEEGLKTIARSIDEIHNACKGYQAQITLEITAGQGTNLGCRFEHIRTIMDLTKETDRLKVCFDTEHAFAAGYDLRTQEVYEQTFTEFDRKVGIEKIAAFHLNDAKKDLGCKVDRHEHIGKGFLGKEAFKLLVNDPRFHGKPMCLETAKGPDLKEDVENLNLLRSLFSG